MSEGPKQTKGKRRPSLSDALQAVKKAGLLEKVRGAVQEKDRVVLTFDDGSVVTGNENENEWTKRLRDLGYGKN
jgi:hypothetical protein